LKSDPVGRQSASAGYLAGSSLYQWFLVLMLTVLYTSSYIDRQILGLLVKPIRADLHISDTEYSYLSGFAFVTMYSIVGIPLGWAVDRWNRRAIIVAGVSVWSLMTAGCGLAGSFSRLFALRIGVGIGEATLSPASYSLISDYFPPGKLSRALSVYGLGIPIGTGLALVIGGSVVQAFERLGPLDLPLLGSTKPWQTVFLTIGLPGLLLAGAAALVIREPSRRLEGDQGNRDAPSIAEAAIFMWKNASIYLSLSFGLGLLVVYAYGAAAWYPAFLQRVQGFSIADAGLFLGTTNMVFGILGSVTAGFLADRLIVRGHSDGQFIVPMIYAVGVTVCGVGAGIAPAPWLSLTFVALSSFFANTTLGCVAAAVQVATPRRMRGQMSAFFLFVAAFVGIAVGPTAVAASTDYIFGYDGAVGYSLALVALVFPALGALTLQLGRRAMHERVMPSHATKPDND
jgi:MFS family permease